MASEMHEAGAPRSHAASPDGGNQTAQRHDWQPSDNPQEELGLFAENVKSHAAAAVQPMKEKTREIAQDQKNVLADRIGGFARAVDTAAEQFAKEAPAGGEMLRAAAGVIQNASASLRDRHIDDLTGMVNRFARNRPAALFAGSVVAGFALSRFLKSSEPERPGPTSR